MSLKENQKAFIEGLKEGVETLEEALANYEDEIEDVPSLYKIKNEICEDFFGYAKQYFQGTINEFIAHFEDKNFEEDEEND